MTVDSFNGQLLILPGTQETLGNFRLSRGVTDISISEGGNLELNGLERATGALLSITEDDSQSLQINNFSHTAGEVIPFLTLRRQVNGGFATTNETGQIVPLQLRSVAIDDAVASDNVAVLNNDVLSSNTTVAAIAFDNLDLGGNRLKVESGAVFREQNGSLTNGELTAGATGNFELIFLAGASRIEANIVDDGENAVSLTIGGTTTLSGTNTFSGTTTVNGGLRVASEDALPDNANLDIFGGSVFFSDLQHSLGLVRITDRGIIDSTSGTEIEFDRLEIEEGTIERDVGLRGNGEIVKTGSGRASLEHNSFISEFSGRVIVQSGILDSNPLEQATFRIEGGELRVNSIAEFNNFELAGGDLIVFGSRGSTQGILSSIDVSEDSRILLDNNFFFDNELTGTGDLTISAANIIEDPGHFFTVRNGNENYSGDVTIGFGTNATFAFTDSLGTGDIIVSDGGTLRFFSQFGGDFTNSSPLAIVNRAITLDNGSIIGNSDNAVLADVTVEGLSSISGGKIIETVGLNDQSRLTLSPTESDPVFIGRLQVNGEAELEFGISTFSSFQDPARQITATVFSGVPNSVLNLQDQKLVNTDLSLSYNIASGHSLEVLNNGLNANLLISERARLSGSGTLSNSITILDAAVVSPADELAETLFIDGSLTLGAGAIYEFSGNLEDLKILSPSADAFSTDLISVTDSLIFSATEDQPFILDISGHESFLSLLNGDQEFSFNIASASEIIGFDETAIQFQGIEDGTLLTLQSDGRNLILSNISVPEPSGALVIFGLSITLLSRRSRRK